MLTTPFLGREFAPGWIERQFRTLFNPFVNLSGVFLKERFSGFRRAVQGVARDVDVCRASPFASDDGLNIETHTCVLKSKADFSSFCMSLNARYNDIHVELL